MVDEAVLDHDVRALERGLDVAAERPLVDLVRAEVGVDEVAALERLLGIDDDRQRVVVDDDVLGRVDDRVAVACR